MTDFTISNHGSIFLLHLHTDAAWAWVEEHIPTDVHLWGESAIVVEHRYIEPIVEGIRADGLEVA